MSLLRAALGLIAAGMVVTLVAGCGSSGAPPQQKARSAATEACSQLLVMGSAVLDGESVTTTAAKETLNAAKNSANHAAQLDKQWAGLASTVKDIADYLEFGPRNALPGTLDDLAVDCRPLVQPSSSS